MSTYPQTRMRRLRHHDWARSPKRRAAEHSEGVARATKNKQAAEP